jgi:hypothetical protein
MGLVIAFGLLALGCSSSGPSQPQVTAERMAHATAIAITMASYQQTKATVWKWEDDSYPGPGTYVACLPIATPRKYTCAVTTVSQWSFDDKQIIYTVTVQSDADLQSPFTAVITSN